MLKMVVSSFYNTLIDKEEAIPSSTMLEIDRIRNKGIQFSVCTNRLYTEIKYYNHDFPFVDYIISLNGSYVYDVKHEKCLFKKKISATNLNKLNNMFPDYKKYYYTATDVYTELVDEDIYKVEVEITDKNEVDKLTKLNFNYSILELDNKMYLEFVNNKISMFTGVDQLSLRNNISLNEILVIGGNDSEYELISNIPNNYVVSNSNDKLKKNTKKKTTSNNEHGVEKVLKRI